MSLPGRPDRSPTNTDHGDVGVVILTALDVEYSAVRRQLDDVRADRHPAGTLFEIGRLAGHPGRVAVGLTGGGTAAAAAITERAIGRYGPDALLFVGVAGALHDDIQLGDVIVATKVYSYHPGKHDAGGEHHRPDAWQAPYELEQLARWLFRDEAWHALLPRGTRAAKPPVVRFKPIAAGEVVLDSRTTPLARRLRRHYNDAAAIDTEGAGVARAGHLNPSTPVMSIRGISDRADGRKAAAERAGSQPVAAAHAAVVARTLAGELLDRRTAPVAHPPAGDPARADADLRAGAADVRPAATDTPPDRRRRSRVGAAAVALAVLVAGGSFGIYAAATDAGSRPPGGGLGTSTPSGGPEVVAAKASLNLSLIQGSPWLLQITGYQWGIGRRVDLYLDAEMSLVFASAVSEAPDGKIEVVVRLDDMPPGTHLITAKPADSSVTVTQKFDMPAQ